MTLQSAISIVTVALVVSRAVNILQLPGDLRFTWGLVRA
jgi:hypothetical protein